MTDRALMNGRMLGGFAWQKHQSVADGEIEIALFHGSVQFANGETGTYAGVETVDFTETKGPFTGHRVFVLADGSLSRQTFEGWTTSSGDGPQQFRGEGHWQTLEGTGRFAGLRGGGKFRWELDGAEYREVFEGT